VARVAVNRIWQAIWGTGLVETPEDLGTRAPVPEYLDLLDWLAVDFMEHDWSQKHLIRTIVTSNTYRQGSLAGPELLQRDPRNAWLARGPRFRADAEVVRDIALSVSGLLTNKLGGPSIIPPVPQNVLDYNFTYPAFWKPAEGPERYRRTLYGFRKRSMPDPVMANFDGPNGDFACARRLRSNTPLAALTSLNEGTPLTLIEAMASERPAISTLVGGVVDLLGRCEPNSIDEGSYAMCARGIGVRSQDVRGFCNGLKFLLDHEAERQAIARRGRGFVEQGYSRERLVSVMLALYEELLQEGGRSPDQL